MSSSNQPHLDLEEKTADKFRKGDAIKTLLLRSLVVLYQYCAGFEISPNVCDIELKSFRWHPAGVVCCDSNEPMTAMQPRSKAVAWQMVGHEAELAKHGLTGETVCAGYWQDGSSRWERCGTENEPQNVAHVCKKLTFLNIHKTCSSLSYIYFINYVRFVCVYLLFSSPFSSFHICQEMLLCHGHGTGHWKK